MNSDEKQEKKNLIVEDKVFNDKEKEEEEEEEEENADLLEGKTLHDLYRHVTKLIK